MYGLQYEKLPEHTQESMRNYIEKGVPTGSFLYAVLSNNLVHSFMYADDANSARLQDFAQFLYRAPLGCWGSEKKVDAWIKRGGLSCYSS